MLLVLGFLMFIFKVDYMKILQLELENFRRIRKATIFFNPTTFIIGPNNTAKSSIIAAIEALLSLEKEKLSQQDILENTDRTRPNFTTITACFGDISDDVAASRGFRGRVINGKFFYRKTLTIDSTKPKIETQEYPSSLKSEYANAKTYKDLLDAGLSEDSIRSAFDNFAPDAKLNKDWHKAIPDALDFNIEAEPIWVPNPGGIPQNVLSRLPRLIHIPALTESKEIESDEKKYALGECLSLLFEDLIINNPLKNEIQEKLTKLEKQMDPSSDESLVKKLLNEINCIIEDVFPKCGISIEPSLQDILSILRPKYDIKVYSNICTNVNRQGTGLIRTCAFAMLRYHARLKIQKELQTRPVLVAFEEPELFLHPSAASLLRDTIYSLGKSDQIICTTHSPWMIDLSRDPQSITKMSIGADDFAVSFNYGVSSIYGRLPVEDKSRIKMLQVFDDELSRVFFAEKVVIVEGDSEVLALKNTLKLFSEEQQREISAKYQIVKARGKASIISLVKYLKDLNIIPFVIHDGDTSVAGAQVFNQHIATAIGDSNLIYILENCLEEVLGYSPPSNDKPYKAFSYTQKWNTIEDVPLKWINALKKAFKDVLI